MIRVEARFGVRLISWSSIISPRLNFQESLRTYIYASFCEQEQNKYTPKVHEYSVYGMVKVNLIYVDSCQTQDGGQNECDDVVMV